MLYILLAIIIIILVSFFIKNTNLQDGSKESEGFIIYDMEKVKTISLNNNSEICVVMIGDNNIIDYYKNSIDINYYYCERNGYDFKAYIGRVLDCYKYKPNFDRYKIIEQLMSKNKNYKYILYIDCDAYFQNPNQNLNEFINLMKEDDILLASLDMNTNTYNRKIYINTGVLLYKNTERSIKMCRDILSKCPECYISACECLGDENSENKIPKYYDQCVIDRLTDYHNNINMIPYGKLQIYKKEKFLYSNLQNSLIVHLPGESMNFRIDCIKKAKNNIVVENFINIPSDLKISVFILNYKRPHNVYKQIQMLSNNPRIDEIVISNGHYDFLVEKNKINNDKVIILDDCDKNINMGIGAGIRWSSMLKCSNDYILCLDDDVVPTNELIDKLISNILRNPETICGPLKRRCDNFGYNMKPLDDYNTILTPILIVKKNTIENYLKEDFNNHINWLKKYKGNCEDLGLNLYLNKKGITPIHVEGTYYELDTSNGYSSMLNHTNIRDNFCKLYF